MIAGPCSNRHPDVIAADLTGKALDPFAADGRTASVPEPEPPVMERADGFALFHPSKPQRSSRVWTPPRDRPRRPAHAEHRDPYPGELERPPTPLGYLVQPAR